MWAKRSVGRPSEVVLLSSNDSARSFRGDLALALLCRTLRYASLSNFQLCKQTSTDTVRIDADALFTREQELAGR